MSQTRPKWLLAALIVAAVLSVSVAGYAAPPLDPTITSPTGAIPVAVKQGNNVYVTFYYTSQPTVAGTTRAEIVIRKGATTIGTRQVAFPLLPDTDEYGAVFTAAVPIDTPVAEGTYNIRLQISNHDGLSYNINEPDAVLVDNTLPGNVNGFGPIVSGAREPVLTWTEPSDFGTPASGIGWYEISIGDGVNPPAVFHDVSAVDPDPLTPGFQWTVPQEFADGNYIVSVWALDRAYNRSALPGTGNLIIDTTKPVLDQQGPVGFVNNASPTLTARFRDLGLGVSGYRLFATPPDVFKLDDGDISPDSEPASGAATGIITKGAGPLAQGSHRVALTLHDRAGNTASLTWEFFVDTVPPSEPASVTAPDPIASGAPAFYWELGGDNGDPQSGVAGYTVEIWTTGVGAARVRGPYTVTDDENTTTADEFDWTLPLPDALTLDGDYEIRVWTVDKAGNSSAAYASDSFRRDTEKPLLDMEEPADTTWTDFVPPTIKVRFRDQGAGATGFGSVDAFTVDDIPYTATGLGTGALGPDFIVADLTGAGLGDGLHKVSITVSDVAGNSKTKTWTFNIDTTNPGPPTDIEVVGGTLAPTPPPVYWTNDPTPQFQWAEGTDSGGSGIADYKVEIYLDGLLEHTYNGVVDEVAGGDVQWTIPDSLADGLYQIRVYSVDNCGNESLYAGVTFGVDSSTSTVMLDQESPKPYVNVSTPTLSVRFRDLAMPSSGYHSTLQFTVDAVSVLPVTSAPGAGHQVGHVTKDMPALADGSHTAYIKVRDYAGNTAALTWDFFVDTEKPNAPGIITVATPTTDTTPSFSWVAATDPGDPVTGSGIAGYEAEIHNGTGLVRGRYYGITGLSWDLPDPLSADGVYTIKLWAMDKAGNVSATSTDATFRLDTTRPVLDNPSPIGATRDDTPDLSIRFSDTGGSGYGSTTAWSITGGTITLPPSAQPASGDQSGDIKGAPGAPLAEGSHTVDITVEDNAGNTATLSWSFTVDKTAPNPPSNVVTVPDPTNDTTPTFTWDAATDNAGGSGIKGYILEVWTTGGGAAKIRGPFTGITGTTYTLLLPDAISPDGEYEVRVWSVDNAENVSGAYGADTFVLDTGKPVLSNGTPTGIQPGTGTLTMQFADDRTGLAGAHTSITIADGLGNAGTVGPYTQPADGAITGQISADYNVPTDGTWTVTATIRDLAGNESDEYTWSFVVDDKPPVVTPIYPTPDTTTWDKWTEIHATIVDKAAPDGTPGSGVDENTIYGVLQGPGVVGLPLLVKDFDPITGLAVLQVPFGFDLADGSYAPSVTAEDMAGNIGGTEWGFLLQQAYAPGMEALPEFNNTDSVTVNWTDVDNEELYELQVDTDPGFGAPTSSFPGFDEVSWKIAGLADGAYYFRIRAVAYGGRVSLWSNTVSTTIDTIRPAAPELRSFPQGPFTNADEVKLVWTTPDGAVRYEVEYVIREFTIPPSETQTTETQEGHTLIVDISSIADSGQMIAKVRAYDAAGNPSDWSSDVEVIVDHTPPTVSAVWPFEKVRTTNPRPTWRWSGNGAISGIDYYVVTLDGELPLETKGISFTPSSPLAHGAHMVRVKAVDKAGNESQNPLEFKEIFVDTVPPAAPAIELLEPAYTNLPGETSRAIDIKWNEITDNPNAIRYTLQWADNEGFSDPTIGTIIGIDGTSRSFTFPRNGGYWFRVKAISIVGFGESKESEWSPIVSTVYDTVGPVAPTLMLLTPDPTNESPQTWSWSAPEGATRYEVQADAGAWINVSDTRTYQTTFNTTGTHYFRVKAYDWLDNEGPEVVGTVYVDLAAPAVPTGLQLTAPAGTDIGGVIYTADGTPKVKWNAVADADLHHYVVEIDGQAWINVGKATAYYEFTEGLADGEHTVKVKAVDELGNESAYSEPLTFIVDTTPPAVPGMPKTTSPTNDATPSWTWELSPGAVDYNVYLDGEAMPRYSVGQPAPGIDMLFHQPEPLAEGTHHLQVTALDALRNESAKSATGHVVIDLTPPGVPVMKTLPPFTNAATVRFEWTKTSADTDHYEISYTVDGGESWSGPLETAGEFCVVNIADVADGVAVIGRVRAYDKAGNVSIWSNELLGAPIASTIVDRTGPVVTITKPAAAVTTNAPTFKYEWTAVDAGCGVASYTVEFNGSKHQVDEANDENKYWYEATLMPGENTFKVFATDKLGNVGEVKTALIVTQVKPQIILVQPMPGAKYKINEISTIAFQVIGLIDAVPEVRLNGELLDEWRIVTVVNTPTMAKFYVLLDADVMVPGTMGIRITVGAGSELFIYTVDSERSGFGFGRLRPW